MENSASSTPKLIIGLGQHSRVPETPPEPDKMNRRRLIKTRQTEQHLG